MQCVTSRVSVTGCGAPLATTSCHPPPTEANRKWHMWNADLVGCDPPPGSQNAALLAALTLSHPLLASLSRCFWPPCNFSFLPPRHLQIFQLIFCYVMHTYEYLCHCCCSFLLPRYQNTIQSNKNVPFKMHLQIHQINFVYIAQIQHTICLIFFSQPKKAKTMNK